METATPRKTTIITLQELDDKDASSHDIFLFKKLFPSGEADYWDVIRRCILIRNFTLGDSLIACILTHIDFTLEPLVINKAPQEPVFVYPGKVIVNGDLDTADRIFVKRLDVKGKLTVRSDKDGNYGGISGDVEAYEIDLSGDGADYGGVIWGKATGKKINVTNRGMIFGEANSDEINVFDGCIKGIATCKVLNLSKNGRVDEINAEVVNRL
ncbi:hypothetical protein [Snodgrassella alvi]|uniref:hypothetical protein n=1 Tax=Snodgrassella alvi TaxID=1196083 RepID=UPI00117A527F|nr:hypothetical protein [Snodgrassella alvi]